MSAYGKVLVVRKPNGYDAFTAELPDMQPEEMAQVLRQAVREGIFRPGQQLVQEDLAKRFNVSRIPVREALRMLAGEGLIISRPGGGAAVRTLTATEVSELYDLRLAIEPALAPSIIENVRPADIRRWEDWVRDLDAQTGMDWVKTNYKLHSDMYAIADRPHTYRIVLSILNFTEQYSHLYMETFNCYRAANDEHRAMLNSIVSREAKILAGLITDHFQAARRGLVELLAAQPSHDALEAFRTF